MYISCTQWWDLLHHRIEYVSDPSEILDHLNDMFQPQVALGFTSIGALEKDVTVGPRNRLTSFHANHVI